jgi:hypothetical protein
MWSGHQIPYKGLYRDALTALRSLRLTSTIFEMSPTVESAYLSRVTQQADLSTFVYSLLGFCALYAIGSAIYTIYFHPLSKFPGPKRAVVSNVSHILHRDHSTLRTQDFLFQSHH